MKRRTTALLLLLSTAIVLIMPGCRILLPTLVVGTSLDWEPFEYIAEDGSYAGFDIELMEEIGRRLNLAIDWREHAFDGLLDLLVDGELDAVVAALNPTPEREARVDFTDPYFTSVDAVLIAPNSTITLHGIEDLAGYRIGVLPGTVQASWIEDTINAEIVRYDQAEGAIAALQNGHVEVVVIDYYSVYAYIDRADVKLALKSEASGDAMAIAVRRGDSTLRDQLNTAIAELHAEGFIEELALKHLSED